MITKLKDNVGYQTFHFLPAKIYAGLEYHVCPGKFHSCASTREAWWTRSPRVVCPQVECPCIMPALLFLTANVWKVIQKK